MCLYQRVEKESLYDKNCNDIQANILILKRLTTTNCIFLFNLINSIEYAVFTESLSKHRLVICYAS